VDPFAGLQFAQMPVTDLGADQTKRWKPNMSRHAPNLTVSTFGEGQL
jgi:hypothetical protein